MPSPTLAAEIASIFFAKGVRSNKLDPESDLHKKAKGVEVAFTTGVDHLRSIFPNEHVRKMMAHTWDAVGGQRVPIMMGPDVPTLTLAVWGSKSAATSKVTAQKAAIVVPQAWLDMIKADPVLQLGAIVFVGSQAVDFVNDQFEGMPDRSRGYEAEYLRTLREKNPTWQPTAYQTAILEDYPDGINTPSVRPLLYTMKPVVKMN